MHNYILVCIDTLSIGKHSGPSCKRMIMYHINILYMWLKQARESLANIRAHFHGKVLFFSEGRGAIVVQLN